MASVSILRRTGFVVLAAGLVLSCAVANSDSAFGQAPATGNAQSGGNTGTKPAKNARPHSGKSKSAKSKAAKAAVEPAPVETRPPDPPPPDWPVNDKAKPASVAWNGRDLSITAANSSLGQILHDVSTATGLKVEGLSGSQGGRNDQRIYGSYGPASERDVLSQLLEGSGYNVIMVGDQGEGAPRELVLAAQAAGGKGAAPRVAQNNQAGEEDAPEEPEPPQPDPQPEQSPRPLNGQPGQPPQGGRTPQQMLQEIQQRQQQMQQQQQPQQGNQTPNE